MLVIMKNIISIVFSFIANLVWFFFIFYFLSREDWREARPYLRDHPHGVIHVADSCVLDLTCQNGDMGERGFGPVVGTLYLGSCKRLQIERPSEPTEDFFTNSHVQNVKYTELNYWLRVYYGNQIV